MIKDFNTYINEDYFSKLANRKDSGWGRTENDTIGNAIKQMKFQDIGMGTLWADGYLFEHDFDWGNKSNDFWETICYSKNELKDLLLKSITRKGYRLPTKEEILKLKTYKVEDDEYKGCFFIGSYKKYLTIKAYGCIADGQSAVGNDAVAYFYCTDGDDILRCSITMDSYLDDDEYKIQINILGDDCREKYPVLLVK